eukprot:1370124-Amphidinium_carterae.1
MGVVTSSIPSLGKGASHRKLLPHDSGPKATHCFSCSLEDPSGGKGGTLLTASEASKSASALHGTLQLCPDFLGFYFSAASSKLHPKPFLSQNGTQK